MLFAVWKPPGITSYDVIRYVKKAVAYSSCAAYGTSNHTGRIRIGHAGTLDPFAEGVLVVGIGRESTKKLGELSKNTEKEYIATLELGVTSTTGDPEGILTKSAPPEAAQNLTRTAIEDALTCFVGEIEQTPPSYSAVKIKGVPAYTLARAGKPVELKSRTVVIHSLDLISWAPPLLTLKIVCSSGTYIRSLGADIGHALKTDAYVKTLLRTRVGPFTLEIAIPVAELAFQVPNIALD